MVEFEKIKRIIIILREKVPAPTSVRTAIIFFEMDGIDKYFSFSLQIPMQTAVQ